MALTLNDTIKRINGNKFSDFKLSTEEEYTDLIDSLITYLKDLINEYTRIEYTNTELFSTYPTGLEYIIIQVVNRALNNISLNMDVPVIGLENYKVLQYIDSLFTEDLKFQLNPYVLKPSIKVSTVGTAYRNDFDYLNDEEDDIEDL